MSEGAVPLAAAAAALQVELGARGFALEPRAFAAHLTLGRARAPSPQPELAGRPLSPAPRLDVRALSLMLSRSTGTGARYETLERFPLE